VRFFVLDEVDRMLDIDSKPDIDKILDHFSMPSVVSSLINIRLITVCIIMNI